MTLGGWRWMPKKLKATKNHKIIILRKSVGLSFQLKKKKEFTTIKKHAMLGSCQCPCDPFKSLAR